MLKALKTKADKSVTPEYGYVPYYCWLVKSIVFKLALNQVCRCSACTYNFLVTQRELRVIKEKAIHEVKSKQAGPQHSYLNYTMDHEDRYNVEIFVA